MNTDREKSRDITQQIVRLVADMWVDDPFMAPVALFANQPGHGAESRHRLETILQESMRNIANLSEHELSAIMRSTYSVRDSLPTWQMLVNAAYAEFVTRRGVEGATSLMVGLIQPNRDTILRNSGVPTK